MSIAPNDYYDRYGLDRTSQEMYGAKTEQEMGVRSLKQYNPVAAQYLNINPDTAPGPKKIPNPTVPKAQSLAPSTAQPKAGAQNVAPLINGTPPPTAGRGFGPSSGLGSEAGSAPTTGVASVRRGFGPHSGLVPPDQEGQHVPPVGPQGPAILNQSARQAIMRMAALPGASPTIMLYARMVAQKGTDY